MGQTSYLPSLSATIKKGKYDGPKWLSCRLDETLSDFEIKVGESNIDLSDCFFKLVLAWLDLHVYKICEHLL